MKHFPMFINFSKKEGNVLKPDSLTSELTLLRLSDFIEHDNSNYGESAIIKTWLRRATSSLV